jgi:hypothetical protein
VIVRLAIMTAVALVSWTQTASLREAEAVRLPVSCSYIANKVMLAPSPGNQLHLIVGDRERKTIRACSPGLHGKCRNWEVHRFDLLCGGRQVSWRQVAGQLLNVPSALEKRDALFRTHLEPWELRSLLADPEFAPVDEFGGRILLLSNKSIPQQSTDMVPKTEPPKPISFPLLQSDASPPQQTSGENPQRSGLQTASAGPGAQAESAEIVASARPSGKADSGPADVVRLTQFEGSKREFNSASDAETAAPVALPDAPLVGKSAMPPEGNLAGLVLSTLADALLLIVIALVILGVMMWWKPAWFRLHPSSSGIVRVTYENEPVDEPEPDVLAEACREMMKQVAAELVNAMSAVNGLKGAPALQAALHIELESIRRSLGFTPQFRGTTGEKKDWKQIRSQLILSLQGTQRIIGIAEAARTSFSLHPAALEVITTRLEAYAFLGVNASASEAVLKRAVNALRECWHPDLATDEEDRRLREIRIKQINVAWDLITGKQMSY